MANNKNIRGTNSDDVLDGTSNDDRIFGRNGNDILIGYNGQDIIYGGEGNDNIDGGEGDDNLRGGKGDDIVLGGGGNDKLNGGWGNDELHGGSGDDMVRGGKGNDKISGGDGNDQLRGGKGDDILDGGEGDDKLFGGKDNDILNGGNGNDHLGGGSGNDILDGGEGDDKLNGGDGNDELFGGAGNDDLRGGKGDDLLEGGEGDDSLRGGSGNDMLFGGAGNDTLRGGKDDDLLIGGAGNDRVSGGKGDDILVYNVGDNVGASDTYFGGADFDTLQLEFSASEWAALNGDLGAISSELISFKDFITENTDETTGQTNGRAFQFESIGLQARKIEDFEVYVAGQLIDYTVVEENNEVIANDDVASASEDAAITINVLDNDDVQDGVANVEIVSNLPEGKGLLSLNPDNSFNFDPGSDFQHLAEGETEVVSFSYEVFDEDGDSAVATTDITVTGTNDAPVANAVTATMQEDDSEFETFAAEMGELTIPNAGYFYVADFDAGTLTGVSRGTDGIFAISDIAPENGVVAYINPNTGSWFITAEAFADGESTLIDPNDINLSGYDGPVSTSGGFLFLEDASNMSLDFSAADLPTPSGAADVAFQINGMSYPGPGGAISMDIAGASVTAVPSPEANQLVITADVEDVDATDTLTFSVDDSLTIGSVINNGDGTFTYEQNKQFGHLSVGETATDTFTYTVDDGKGGTATETVTITIQGENEAPDAQALEASVFESASFVPGYSEEFGEKLVPNAGFFYVADMDAGTLTGVARGPGALIPDDVAPENGVVLYFNPNTGSWFVNATTYADGVATPYDPTDIRIGGYDGVTETANDTLFLFEAAESMSLSLTLDGLQTVNGFADAVITVDNINYAGPDAPVEVNIGNVTIDVAPSGQPTTVTIAADATDPDQADILTYMIDDSDTIGLVTNNGDGTFTYSANGQFSGLDAGETATDWFSYTVADGNGGFDTEIVAVTINGTNDAPEIIEDFDLLM